VSRHFAQSPARSNYTIWRFKGVFRNPSGCAREFGDQPANKKTARRLCVATWQIEKAAGHFSPPQSLSCGLRVKIEGVSTSHADSDDLARVFRFDLAQDSEMISPTIPI
jgi:hypothetical protein